MDVSTCNTPLKIGSRSLPMKTLLTFVLFTSLGLCISCDLGLGIHELTELEKLPPLTTTGENTFGCLVNGEALVVENTLEMGAIYQGGFLQMGGGVENGQIDHGVFIKLNNPLEKFFEYDLTDSLDRYSTYTFKDKVASFTCYYEYNDTFDGTLTFHEIDRSNYIISGTFEFSTVTDDCDTVYITDGRFDLQYIP